MKALRTPALIKIFAEIFLFVSFFLSFFFFFFFYVMLIANPKILGLVM